MKDIYTTRELFNRIINFKDVPRTIKWEFGYWGKTISRWYKEGLPQKSDIINRVEENDSVAGPSLPAYYNEKENGLLIDTDILECFGFDKGMRYAPYHYFYYPVYKERIIEEDDRYVIKYNEFNIKIRDFKDKSSMPFWLEFPVKDRTDWEKLKEERLRLDSIGERFIGDKETVLKEAGKRDYVLGVFGGFGFFGTLRFMMGEERLFKAYYDSPDLVKDIAGHLCELWLAMAEELISKIDFDLAYFWEDMSGKNGSLISPDTFKEFMTPYYKKITSFLKSKGIKKCTVDTDGNVEELIPLFMEAGINLMYPFERQAGNDLLKFRSRYPDLVMLGGFDKNTLYKGKVEIDRELEISKRLISGGGYIPFCDHLIPPNASWENFKYYRNKLNRIIDGS